MRADVSALKAVEACKQPAARKRRVATKYCTAKQNFGEIRAACARSMQQSSADDWRYSEIEKDLWLQLNHRPWCAQPRTHIIRGCHLERYNVICWRALVWRSHAPGTDTRSLTPTKCIPRRTAHGATPLEEICTTERAWFMIMAAVLISSSHDSYTAISVCIVCYSGYCCCVYWACRTFMAHGSSLIAANASTINSLLL